MVASRPYSQGYDGSRYAVVVYDLGASYRDCFPTGDRDAIDAILALQHFIGPRASVQSFHCDGAKEFFKAAVDLGLRLSTSRPY